MKRKKINWGKVIIVFIAIIVVISGGNFCYEKITDYNKIQISKYQEWEKKEIIEYNEFVKKCERTGNWTGIGYKRWRVNNLPKVYQMEVIEK